MKHPVEIEKKYLPRHGPSPASAQPARPDIAAPAECARNARSQASGENSTNRKTPAARAPSGATFCALLRAKYLLDRLFFILSR
ncbi:hypothetical protein LMG18095_00011 [Ralstonia thomasii]|jgi:hypothetical protein|uniref:Uncharacterized protein n=1 Tax=Ralstonia thomasii TaxID=3058596 RepID=A0ABM9IX31_9RALS|nr:hypothetical protein LMG18095_00011 [Ralstonia sp. LMG 18095]